MERIKQLKELDVMREAEELNPAFFLKAYIASNFPQTMALPSKQQRQSTLTGNQNSQNRLEFKKSGPAQSGTSYDRPQAY